MPLNAYLSKYRAHSRFALFEKTQENSDACERDAFLLSSLYFVANVKGERYLFSTEDFMKLRKLFGLLLPLLAVVASPALAELRDFTIETGVSPCVSNNAGRRCDKPTYLSEGIQLDLVKGQSWTKVIKAEQLSVPYSFYVVPFIKFSEKTKKYLFRLFIYSAADGTDHGSFATNLSKIDDLNDVILGSGMVSVSPTEGYRLWVKLRLK